MGDEGEFRKKVAAYCIGQGAAAFYIRKGYEVCSDILYFMRI